MSTMMMAKMAVGGNPMNQSLVDQPDDEEGGGGAVPLPDNATICQKIAAADGSAKRKITLVATVSLASILLNALVVVTNACIICLPILAMVLVSAPFVIKNEIELSTFAGKRDMFNKIREEANRMSEINDELHDSVDEVEANVERTKRITKKLGAVCDGQQANVERLVELVKENGEIIEGMKENLAKSAVQTIIRVVLTADEDRSFEIEEHEVSKTALKVYIELQAQDIEIRIKKFQDAIRAHPKLEDLVQMLKNVLDSNKDNPSSDKKDKKGDFEFIVVDLDKIRKEDDPIPADIFWETYEAGKKFAPIQGKRRWGKRESKKTSNPPPTPPPPPPKEEDSE